MEVNRGRRGHVWRRRRDRFGETRDGALGSMAMPPHATPDRLASQGGTPVRARFLPLAVPSIGEREKALVLQALDSGWITTGPRAQELSAGIAKLAGAGHGLAVSSATAALHLGLVGCGVQ